MLLYENADSGNCYKVRLLLAHLDLDYERRSLSVTDRSDRPDVIGDLNPALRVPTLVLDDGRPLAESDAILWYFGEGTRFVPDDRYERAKVLQWMFFEQYDHEPTIAVVRFCVALSGEPEKHAARVAELMPARISRARRDRDGTRRPVVPGRRLDDDRRHRAVRLYTRRPRGRDSTSATTRTCGRGFSASRPSRDTWRSTRSAMDRVRRGASDVSGATSAPCGRGSSPWRPCRPAAASSSGSGTRRRNRARSSRRPRT